MDWRVNLERDAGLIYMNDKFFLSEEIQLSVTKGIEKIYDDFLRYPHVFLTEEDVRCNLYREILTADNSAKNKYLLKLYKSEDNLLSTMLHSEVRWIGQSQKLRYRSDLVVSEPRSMILKTSDLVKLPTKGYGFNNFYSIIEIKLRRITGKSNKSFLKNVENDLNRIIEIHDDTMANHDHYPKYFFICIDKKSNISESIRPLFITYKSKLSNLEMYYAPKLFDILSTLHIITLY